MRPWRTGTRSGSRVAFCASSNAIGSGRSSAGTQPVWLDRPVCSRADLPIARRSSTLRWMTVVTASLLPAIRYTYATRRSRTTYAMISASGKKHKLRMKYPRKLCPFLPATRAGQNATRSRNSGHVTGHSCARSTRDQSSKHSPSWRHPDRTIPCRRLARVTRTTGGRRRVRAGGGRTRRRRLARRGRAAPKW